MERDESSSTFERVDQPRKELVPFCLPDTTDAVFAIAPRVHLAHGSVEYPVTSRPIGWSTTALRDKCDDASYCSSSGSGVVIRFLPKAAHAYLPSTEQCCRVPASAGHHRDPHRRERIDPHRAGMTDFGPQPELPVHAAPPCVQCPALGGKAVIRLRMTRSSSHTQ